MTIPVGKPASLAFMQLNPFPPLRTGVRLAACLLLPFTVRADEPPLKDLLRDGLYAEEVSRDPEAAAKQYEQVIERYSEQRAFAASALFRLAEVRRKQDRKDDAEKLYQRLLGEFPGAEIEAKLARENLAALGAAPAEAVPAQGDAEARELARLQAAAKSSPDVLRDPQTMWMALSNDMPGVVKFLLESGSRPYDVDDALSLAVQKGNLEITRLFLERGGEVPPKLAREAIGSAITYNRPTILEFLLEKGLRPVAVGEYGESPLAQALDGERYQAAETLLKHGADLNEMAAPNASDYWSGGTPLHHCIRKGRYDAVSWLLEKGAKPDIATPRYGVTPLHLAVFRSDPGTLALMEKLLVAGADPNHPSGSDTTNSQHNTTPLEFAISSSSLNVEMVEMLLKHGGKPDRKDSQAAHKLSSVIGEQYPNITRLTTLLGEAGMSMQPPRIIQAAAEKGDAELVSLVLKYGADPNATDKKGNSLLAQACANEDVAMTKAFLGAGADPKKPAFDLLRTAAGRSSVEILTLLADAGLTPAPEWKADRYSGASQEAVGFLLDRFLLPELTAETGAHFVMDLGKGLETVRIWNGDAGQEPPLLARWLLDRAGKMHFAVLSDSNRPAEYEWSLHRKDGRGGLEKTRLDLAGSEPLPTLKPGDAVVCRMVTSLKNQNFSWQNMTTDMEWSLKKRITFPITVTLAGNRREVTVRGDRLFFDPTKPEVPLADARQVMDFLWQPSAHAEGIPATILVKRKGWPDVRMACGSKEAGQFQLEPADELTLDLPPDTVAKLDELSQRSVTLKAVGVPFSRSFYGETQNGKTESATLPTLIQALLETQVPWTEEWKEWGEAAWSGKVDLAAAGRVFRGFEILPHPDLSRIRILRLTGDGKETVMKIDLAAAMSADITLEAARKADVILQPGDIVEIPLKDTAGPWKGFTEDEKRFFAKALSGKVRVVDTEGKLSFTEINCRPPDFIETASGWLPVPPPTGVPSARPWWVLGNIGGEWKRGDVGKSFASDSSGFLRDGDEWKSSGSSNPPQRAPRPRTFQPQAPEGYNSLPSPIR